MEKQKERLEKLMIESDILCDTCGENTRSYCVEALAESILADGWTRPPCKVGDKVYVICNYEVQETTVFSIKMETEDGKYVVYVKAKAFDGSRLTVDGDYVAVFKTFLFGKTVFLTKEEAEQALRKDEGK